jgi:hypothetical protein
VRVIHNRGGDDLEKLILTLTPPDFESVNLHSDEEVKKLYDQLHESFRATTKLQLYYHYWKGQLFEKLQYIVEAKENKEQYWYPRPVALINCL